MSYRSCRAGAASERVRPPLIPGPRKSHSVGPSRALDGFCPNRLLRLHEARGCVSTRELTGDLGGVTRAEIALRLRRQLPALICDDSDGERAGVALYTLSDPRDVRAVRYVGQSRAPLRRYRQHVRAACLALDARAPWWIRQPDLGPLHAWIRALHADGGRLPFMLITQWVPSVAAARLLEQSLITSHRMAGCPLLNCEALREATRNHSSE